MLSRNAAYGVFITALLCLAFFPLALPSSFSLKEHPEGEFGQIPLVLGEWQGSGTELDERTYQILETRNVLSRLYKNQIGETIHLLLVGSHRDRRVAHPPEVCYTSSHYTITNTEDRQIEVGGLEIPVREFVAKNTKTQDQDEQILYVYKVGDRFTSNYYAQQLRFAWDRLSRNESQVLLIRLAGPDRKAFQAFLVQLFPHLP